MGAKGLIGGGERAGTWRERRRQTDTGKRTRAAKKSREEKVKGSDGSHSKDAPRLLRKEPAQRPRAVGGEGLHLLPEVELTVLPFSILGKLWAEIGEFQARSLPRPSS